jgi:hypothetical protein
MTKLIYASPLRVIIVFLMATLSIAFSAIAFSSESVIDNDVTINLALEAAQAHTAGKVVSQEKADVLFSEKGAVKASESLQPVYRIKILSKQGIMKTILVHRKTGLILE